MNVIACSYIVAMSNLPSCYKTNDWDHWLPGSPGSQPKIIRSAKQNYYFRRMYRKVGQLFQNKATFNGEELLAPRPNPKLDDHPFSAFRHVT